MAVPVSALAHAMIRSKVTVTTAWKLRVKQETYFNPLQCAAGVSLLG